MVISLNYHLKINYPIILSIGVVLSGLILNTWATVYLISSRLNDPFEWIYKTMIWGVILTISGLILLLYLVLLKKKTN